MRQGLLAIMFLLVGLFTRVSLATQMTQDDVSAWLVDAQVQISVEQLYQDAVKDDATKIQDTLQRMPLPKQEVVRFLLLKKIENEQLVLTPRLAIFIQSQKNHQPIYQAVEISDDYSTEYPVFNASLIANRLIRTWKQDQTNIDFIIAAESGDLQLATWMQGDAFQQKQREELFLNEVESLSPSALHSLSEQLVGPGVVKWLPSSRVVIKLAQLTEDPRLYDLLWKMKVNDYSIKEVSRLAQQADAFSIQQLMNATKNPALKSDAIAGLVRLQPMPESVETFLVEKLKQNSDGLMVARALSDSAHHSWLISLLQQGQISHAQDLLKSVQAEANIITP